jgi:CRISPR/Cas system-associated exonuclease Cas4 (RecB family)
MRPVVYSASSVTSYQTCHLQWWFTYVLGEEGEQSEAQRVGIKIHDFAQRSLEHLGTAYQTDDPEVAPLAAVWNRHILPTYRYPILIEAAFQLEVNDIPYSGILDAVDEQDVPWGTELILRDLKSTRSRPAPGKYRFAMTGYLLGAEDLLGREIKAAQLDWIVRTKTPYYWPEVLDEITQDDVDAFAVTLERVANGVERGDYEPTGLGTWACKACSHRAICGPYQRYQEVTDGD